MHVYLLSILKRFGRSECKTNLCITVQSNYIVYEALMIQMSVYDLIYLYVRPVFTFVVSSLSFYSDST